MFICGSYQRWGVFFLVLLAIFLDISSLGFGMLPWEGVVPFSIVEASPEQRFLPRCRQWWSLHLLGALVQSLFAATIALGHDGLRQLDLRVVEILGSFPLVRNDNHSN